MIASILVAVALVVAAVAILAILVVLGKAKALKEAEEQGY